MRRQYLLLVAASIVMGIASFPVPAQATGGQLSQASSITNDDVLTMTKAALSEEIILAKIQSSPTNFDTSPAALSSLRSEQVSNAVILAMLKSPSQTAAKADPDPTASLRQPEPNGVTADPAKGSVEPPTQFKADERLPLLVAHIQVSNDLQVPSDWLAEFSGRLVDLLKYSNKFSHVVSAVDNEAPQQRSETLRVTLIGFKKGSRTMRYMVGFGAGQEKMAASVVLNGADGAALFSSNFASTTTMGFYGSKSGETPRKLAEKIVRALP